MAPLPTGGPDAAPRSSPQGTRRTCSAGSRPPPSTAVTTASGPSNACTRTSARPARSSASPTSPQSPSCSAPAVTVSSGTSRSLSTAPRPPLTSQESSCQRTRSAVPDGVSGSAHRQTRRSSSPATVRAPTPRRVHDSPCPASTSCSRCASVRAANAAASTLSTGGSSSSSTASSAGGHRRTGGRGSRPRASRCASTASAPNRDATSPAASAPNAPRLRSPSRRSSPTSSDRSTSGSRSSSSTAERGEEGGRVARGDGHAAPGGEHRGEQPLGDPGLALHPGAAGHLVHEPLRGRQLAAEVARRALDGQRQQPRPDHLDARRQLLDGRDDRLEQPGVAVGVAGQHHELGAPGLGLAAAQAAPDPGGPGDGGAGEHPVRDDDRGGPLRGDVRGPRRRGDRPVRRPEREHPHGPGHPASRSSTSRSAATRRRHRPRRRPRASARGSGQQQPGTAAGGSDTAPAQLHAHLPPGQPPDVALPGVHPPPPPLLAGQLQVRPRPRPERQQHRALLPGPGGQPLPVAGVLHPARHGHEVQPVEQRGGHRHQVRSGVRDERQAFERDPRLGRGHQPEIRAADHTGPGAPGRGLGEQRQHQRGGARRARDRHRRTPPQPATGQQRGQRRDDREHPAVGSRFGNRTHTRRPVLQAPQEPAGRRQPVRGVELTVGSRADRGTGRQPLAHARLPGRPRPRGRQHSN